MQIQVTLQGVDQATSLPFPYIDWLQSGCLLTCWNLPIQFQTDTCRPSMKISKLRIRGDSGNCLLSVAECSVIDQTARFRPIYYIGLNRAVTNLQKKTSLLRQSCDSESKAVSTTAHGSCLFVVVYFVINAGTDIPKKFQSTTNTTQTASEHTISKNHFLLMKRGTLQSLPRLSHVRHSPYHTPYH